MTSKIPIIEPQNFLDVIVVGGGPNGLAVVSRLLEERPSSLYTDQEHARLHWLKKYNNPQRALHTNRRGTKLTRKQQRKEAKYNNTSNNNHNNNKCDGKCDIESSGTTRDGDVDYGFDLNEYPSHLKYRYSEQGIEERKKKILVLDSHGDSWMSQWDSFFKAYEISHLRSPMFFHTNPADIDSLLAYAHETDQHGELIPIQGVVGHELSKHKKKQQRYGGKNIHEVLINERNRQDYYRPSTKLFKEFCQEQIVTRYGIQDFVRHSKVLRLSSGPVHIKGQGIKYPENNYGIIIVESLDKKTGQIMLYAASAVVLAVGSQSSPSIPKVLSPCGNEIMGPGYCHSTCISHPDFKFPPPLIQQKMEQKSASSVLIIGGGLTSAQISDLCVRKGFTNVILIMRGHVKVKHFDFDLKWAAKYANVYKMQFWQTDCRQERMAQLMDARNGGSMNPTFYSIIKNHAANKKMQILTQTQIIKADWCQDKNNWNLVVETKEKAGSSKKRHTECIDNYDSESIRLVQQQIQVDYIISATGGKMSIKDEPYLKDIFKSHPIQDVDGYPVFENPDDLQWNYDLPLFVVGPYASLELGPQGPNLGGAREGAERIANRLFSMWSENRQLDSTHHGYWTLAQNEEDNIESD